MAKFFLRSTKTDGEANLFVGVHRPSFGVHWKVNTHIKVSVSAWNKAQTSAKALQKYYSTDEGESVRQKTDMAARIVKEYFGDCVGTPCVSDLEELMCSVVNADISLKRAQLEELEKEENELKAKQLLNSQGEVLAFYESFFEGIQDGSVRHGDSKRYTPASITNWRSFGKQLRGFLCQTKREGLHFNEINRATATAFVTYLENDGMMKETIGQAVNSFRKLCNLAAEEGKNTNAVSLRVWKSPTAKDADKRAEIAISDDEVDAIYNMQLSGHAEKCRDMWMMGYFSAQRVSDFSVFGRENFCVNEDGTPVIKVKQKKTGTELEVPIFDDRVFELCDKYDYNFPRLGRDAINRGIKGVCKAISEQVPSFGQWEVTLLSKKETDKEKWFMEARKKVAAGEKLPVEEAKRYKKCLEYATEHDSGNMLYKRDYQGRVIRQRWELVSCHTTRRSMITNLHRTGLLTDREIMSVSGHTTLKSFEKYMKVGVSERATTVFEKLKKAKEVAMRKEA